MRKTSRLPLPRKPRWCSSFPTPSRNEVLVCVCVSLNSRLLFLQTIVALRQDGRCLQATAAQLADNKCYYQQQRRQQQERKRTTKHPWERAGGNAFAYSANPAGSPSPDVSASLCLCYCVENSLRQHKGSPQSASSTLTRRWPHAIKSTPGNEKTNNRSNIRALCCESLLRRAFIKACLDDKVTNDAWLDRSDASTPQTALKVSQRRVHFRVLMPEMVTAAQSPSSERAVSAS